MQAGVASQNGQEGLEVHTAIWDLLEYLKGPVTQTIARRLKLDKATLIQSPTTLLGAFSSA